MKNQKKNKNTLGIIVGVAVGLIVYFLVKQFVFAQPSFDKVMMEAASKINESCPIMVDQDTRLDNVTALPDNVLQYNYTLLRLEKKSTDVKALEDYMQPVLLNNVKTNPDLKMYRDNETTMAYNYKDKNGEYITTISISANQYSD
jgi:hypothetical protein